MIETKGSPTSKRPFVPGEAVLVVGLGGRRRARFVRYHDRELTVASVKLDRWLSTLMLPAKALERTEKAA